MAKELLLRKDMDFLPAALELESKAGFTCRPYCYVDCSHLFIAMSTWSYLRKIDIVVVAVHGKVRYSGGQVKQIQSLHSAIINKIRSKMVRR